MHQLSLACTGDACELSYVAFLANQTSDFSPIPQGAFVGFLADGGFAIRPDLGDLTCDNTPMCGALETSMTITGDIPFPRDNPIAYLGWVGGDTCSVRKTDGLITCSTDPTTDDAHYFWTPLVPISSAACAQLLGEGMFEEMVAGDCAFDGLDLSGRVLSNLDLTGISAPGVNFAEATLSSVTFDQADLTGAIFTEAIASDSTFVGAELRDSTWTAAVVQRADFTSAEMGGAKMSNANFSESDFTDADLNQAVCNSTDFRFTNMRRTVFTSVLCASADFTSSQVIQADFTNALLDNADFRNATMQQVDWDGVNLDNVLGVE